MKNLETPSNTGRVGRYDKMACIFVQFVYPQITLLMGTTFSARQP